MLRNYFPRRTVKLSEVVVHTGNGNGTNASNKIRRFTTVFLTRGSAITYLDTAATGATFTINQTGWYEMFLADGGSGAATDIGFSVNQSDLTTAISALSLAAGKLGIGHSVAANNTGTVTIRAYLNSGDVVRAVNNGASTIDGSDNIMMRISKAEG